MKEKQQRLRKLLAVRRLHEEVDRCALQLTLGQVAEVKVALSSEKRLANEAKQSTRVALTAGDRYERLLAKVQDELTGWNRDRLDRLLREREANVAAVMHQFLESRRQHEQVLLLMKAEKQKAILEENRTEQKEADDWFLNQSFRSMRRER